MPSARDPWILAATLDSESVMSCTWAEWAVTSMTLPTSPLPASASPATGWRPPPAWSTSSPSAEPLSIVDPGLPPGGRLADDPGHHEVGAVREGPLVLEIEQALEALVLLSLLLEFDDLALQHLHLLREALGVLVGRPEGRQPVVAVLEGLGDAVAPGLQRGEKSGRALLDGVDGTGFGLAERDCEQSERSDDQDDEDDPSPGYLVARHTEPR